jgi:hypothetical protein
MHDNIHSGSTTAEGPALDAERLDAYQVALEFHALAGGLPLGRGRGELRDQLDRASTSIVLNIAEGAGRRGGADRARFFAIARGSATEDDHRSRMKWLGPVVGRPCNSARAELRRPYLSGNTCRWAYAGPETVVARWSVRGTQCGPFQGIVPAGRPIVLAGTTVHHMANGKITETWLSMDNLDLLRQLGAIPRPNPGRAS